jgi:electron transport complex protein RnfD
MKLVVSASPHIHCGLTTRTVMRDVVIALMPALAASVWIFGWRCLLVTAVCVGCCVLFEWGYEKLNKMPSTIGDLSAVVTGVLLAYNLPVSIPLWQAAFGCLVAIVAVKMLFGGIGKNFANPAITARIVLLLAFSGTMTEWVFPDAISGATPLAIIKFGDPSKLPSLYKMFFGLHAGCIGETCIAALLMGFAYLLIRRVVTWHAPVAYIATVFLFTLALGKEPVYQILSGSLILGAVFMATDYVTTPQTPWGRVIFGFGCGILTVLIRVYGSYAEGVSFAILFMNILTPYISRWTASRPLGGGKG